MQDSIGQRLPLVSVIITTYNSSGTISDVLRSILSQYGHGESFELEILVIDDCSTDKTPEIVSQFPVTFIQQNANRGGPNFGRNLGLELCAGQVICLSDHDDIWLPEKIIKCLSFLNQAPIVSCGYLERRGKRDRTVVYGNREGFRFFARNETFLNRLTRKYPAQNTYLSSLMFTNSLSHIKFEEIHGQIDYDWLLRLFHEQSSIEVCAPLFIRQVQGSNLSLDETYRLKNMEYSILTLKEYELAYPKETKLGLQRIYGSMGRFYYLIGEMKKARYFLNKSEFSWKKYLYLLTSFVGHRLVRKKFHIFG